MKFFHSHLRVFFIKIWECAQLFRCSAANSEIASGPLARMMTKAAIGKTIRIH